MRQEHETDPSKFPHSEVEAHEQAFLQLMDLSWAKCDLLGLEDQKKIFIEISDENGFSEEQALEEDVQDEYHPPKKYEETFSGYTLSQRMTSQDIPIEEESYDKELEDEICEAPFYDNILSSIFHDDHIVHDDFWSSFGFHMYDTS